ncbi:MAG: glycoside hydrolase family 15 protein [Prolixibacteraceae bacterium]|jgi:GH15 family glucan-1,4-alpha-glucosidase|nr:glycoside hydrolase family 15 protein [Prolixibacteraceae bacterium]
MSNLNYGIIGNCRSGALVSEKGDIEWCCLPDFNSPSVFAALLDRDKGGTFSIIPAKGTEIKQSYIPRTNILQTSFRKGNDCFHIYDFMPRYINGNDQHYNPPDIIRYIQKVSGSPWFRVKYNPRLEYAFGETRNETRTDYIKSYTVSGVYDSLYLYTNFDKQKILDSTELELTGDGFFLLSYNQKLLQQNIERTNLKFERTKVYWLNWSEKTRKFLKYNEEITRSALALKLLSFDKSGAVLAALTTSLPESIGEVRNWDYRFCWIRDASMVIKVMTSLGHMNIAARYLQFINRIIPDKDEKLQIMYGINGEKKLSERILEHFEGYEKSAPVRIGNAAYKQKQNDIYGILMDVIYQHFNIYNVSLAMSEELWTIVRSIVKTVDRNWQKPDRGIWELRNEQKHFTFSKVLCWVAIDRAVKIAGLLKMDRHSQQWELLRDKIKTDIIKNAWNEKLQSFTQFYGSDDLDASNLLIENYGFLPASDERYKKTVLETRKQLMHNGLMYRYKNKDDFGLPTSSFTICTFWMINSLFKIGEKADAKRLFDQLLSYSNHLGLFSEDIDFESKRLLGNFPQAYSHLALIETAINLSDAEVITDQELLDEIHGD